VSCVVEVIHIVLTTSYFNLHIALNANELFISEFSAVCPEKCDNIGQQRKYLGSESSKRSRRSMSTMFRK